MTKINLNKIDVSYTVVNPQEKEIQEKHNLILSKLEDLECISKLHPSYATKMMEIQQLRKQINNLKKSIKW